MDRAQIVPLVGQLRTVTLKDGMVLTGTLIEMAPPTLGFAIRSAGNVSRVFDAADVANLERAHPALEKAYEAECTCSHTNDLALDGDNWLRWPFHGPVIDPIASYEEFRTVFFTGLYDFAQAMNLGERLDSEGEYKRAAFTLAADYKPAGEEHAIQVVVTSKSGYSAGRRKTLLKNWKSDEPDAVAQEAVETLQLLTR